MYLTIWVFCPYIQRSLPQCSDQSITFFAVKTIIWTNQRKCSFLFIELLLKPILIGQKIAWKINPIFLSAICEACFSQHCAGMPEQARLAWPQSGLDFQIHKSKNYLVTILEALLLTIGLAWQKSVPASLLCAVVSQVYFLSGRFTPKLGPQWSRDQRGN